MVERIASGRRTSFSREKASELAVSALIFLTEDFDRLGRFLALTGLDPKSVREQAQSAAFQRAVLEHLLKDESLLLTFCAQNNIDPPEIDRASRALDDRDG